MIKILFLSADPSDSTRLRLGQELRDIKEKLRLSNQRDEFILDSRESVRPGDITQAIHDFSPQVIHFSGHGSIEGELCFENVIGKVQPIEPNALERLFELISDQVVCVVLNACYSHVQAEAISKHIPFVVGMQKAIGDKAAIAFSVGFYKALGAGYSFEKAYKFGKVEIELEGIQESLTPILYTKAERNTQIEQATTTHLLQISTLPSSISPANLQADNYVEVPLIDSTQTISLEEAMRRFDVSPIVKRYGTWAVTSYGVECLSTYYPIEMNRVDEQDWLNHMRGKTWANIPDFSAAISHACKLNKMQRSFSILNQPLKVFLCHGNEDKPAVRNLYKQLLDFGIKPWLDEENLLPGQEWKYEITKAVSESDIVIVCLSCTSVSKSGFVQKEIKYALDIADEKPEGSIFLIPARLEECPIPNRLSGRQWVDLFQEDGFERLLKSLQACAGQQ